MSDERSVLERQLLGKPYDVDLRARYARLLQESAEFGASLEQWRLIGQQEPRSAEPQLQAALCCRALNDAGGVGAHLKQAQSCADFDPRDSRIAQLTPLAQPNLRVLKGGATPTTFSEVVSLGRSGTVRFADIVGMEELKRLVRMRIVEPFLRPGLFQRFKKSAGGGVLLYGPPGCGKTMMARAIAHECHASFTAIGISDVLSMWIGGSEHNLAAVFDKGRGEAPGVIFFDELDALAYSRSKAHSDHTRSMVNEFLNQLDGMAGRNEKLLVLGATNMPWDVDGAMKRPGRFDRQIFIPPPDEKARAEMFRLKLRDVPCGALDVNALARRCAHFSGADIDGVIEAAKEVALDEILESGQERELVQSDFEAGITGATASTLEWLKTARNLVKFGGAGGQYKDVESYLRETKLF